MNDGSLTIKTGGIKIEGWEEIRVTRGMERCPNDFSIRMTEKFKKELSRVVIAPGSACEVWLGKDKVITGYVDRYIPSIASNRHSVQLTGRGRCQDLVDCSAKYEGGSFRNMTLKGIAEALSKPFGIQVIASKALDDAQNPIPTFPLMYGETVMEIVERVARYKKVIAYENPDGNLVLTGVSSLRHKTAIVEGQNVQAATMIYNNDQRHSSYTAYLTAIDNLNEYSGHKTALSEIEPVLDEGIKRYRPLIMIVETGDAGYQVTRDRLVWERNRRRGRGQMLRVTVDSWRDGSGALWEPNKQVSVHLPTLHVGVGKDVAYSVDWTISEVTYIRNAQQGTVAELTIMPPESFSPEPIVFQPTPLSEFAIPVPGVTSG